VVPEDGVIPVRKDFPLEYAALMACCVPTGWGTVTNIAQVKPGDSVAVWGIGGVGLNILRAAHMRQANPLIAVDLEPAREAIAREFSAVSTVPSPPHNDIPKLVDLAMTGEMKLDKLVAGKFKLEDINDIAERMAKRQLTGRWVCEWD